VPEAATPEKSKGVGTPVDWIIIIIITNSNRVINI